MKFCSSCGSRVTEQVSNGEKRPPLVCMMCGPVHHPGPRLIVGCLPVHDNKVLLCRRAIQPRKGYWTLPAGFMEKGESSMQGAARETWEEARAKVTDLELYRLIEVPHMGQVHLLYRCHLLGGVHGVGPESSECRLFAEQNVPWDELAFPSLMETLLNFFSDAASGHFPFGILTNAPQGSGLSPENASFQFFNQRQRMS